MQDRRQRLRNELLLKYGLMMHLYVKISRQEMIYKLISDSYYEFTFGCLEYVSFEGELVPAANHRQYFATT